MTMIVQCRSERVMRKSWTMKTIRSNGFQMKWKSWLELGSSGSYPCFRKADEYNLSVTTLSFNDSSRYTSVLKNERSFCKPEYIKKLVNRNMKSWFPLSLGVWGNTRMVVYPALAEIENSDCSELSFLQLPWEASALCSPQTVQLSVSMTRWS